MKAVGCSDKEHTGSVMAVQDSGASTTYVRDASQLFNHVQLKMFLTHLFEEPRSPEPVKSYPPRSEFLTPPVTVS